LHCYYKELTQTALFCSFWRAWYHLKKLLRRFWGPRLSGGVATV